LKKQRTKIIKKVENKAKKKERKKTYKKKKEYREKKRIKGIVNSFSYIHYGEYFVIWS